MARIFISYSRKDESFARRLAGALSNMGADVWIDVEDIPAGMKWSSAIQQGLDSGELLIVVISPDSMVSRNVEDEWQYYLDHGKAVVPVLLEPAKIHFQLNRLQYIDFHMQAFDIAINQLYAELRRKGLSLNPPAQPQPAAGQTLPNFDRLTPEEIDRALTELQKRREQFDPAAAVPYPAPRQTQSPNRIWLLLGGLIAAVTVVGIGISLLASLNIFGTGDQPTGTPPATEVAQGELDSDGDGLSDAREAEQGTDPNQFDTDGDGKSDGEEVNTFGTNPLDNDTDDDGIDDGDEILGCTDPLNWDTDGDDIADHIEVEEGTACLENTPTPDAPVLGLSADNPVTHNDDWSQISRMFGDIEMALVPVGMFVMGTSPDEINAFYRDCESYITNCQRSALFNDETPQIEIAFDEPFWIGVYEMANWQVNRRDDSLPVTQVTWQDAQNYCEGLGMRLPTEAEWEYASRGPDALTYPFGNEFPGAIFNYCDESCSLDVGWKDTSHNDGYPELAPVGSLSENGSWVGAYDMAGNVWEWTSTIYHDTPGDSHGHEVPDDPESQRVLKGSSWNWIALEGRGAARSPHAANNPSSPWYGFRCAKDLDPADLS